MKKIFREKMIGRLVTSAAVVLILASGFVFPTHAAEKTYKVVIRAGIQGDFSLNDVVAKEESAKKLVFEVKAGEDFSIQSTAAIVTIASSKYSGKYFVQDESVSFQQIDRNQEYVIQYGRLVDGVEYKIEYVDNATGVQIADPKFAWGSDTLNTPATYAKNIGDYALVSSSPQTIKLDKSASANTITFRYNSTLSGGTTTNTTYQTVDGGIENVYETQQNPVYQVVPGVAGAARVAATGGGNNGADTTEIADGGTPLDARVPTPQTTPSDESKEKNDGAEKTIEEEDAPLAANMNQPISLVAIIPIMLGGIALILIAVWIVTRRKMAGVTEEDSSDTKDKDN